MNSIAFSKNKYEAGDKVFAKVKNCPYWPAKIMSVDKTSADIVWYRVLFYGSYRIGVLKEERLCNYTENKQFYGKLRSSSKTFETAILDIEADIEGFTKIGSKISHFFSITKNLKPELNAPYQLTSVPINIQREFILATKQSGETVKIPLNLNRPHFTDDNRKAKWDAIVLQQAKLLKTRIERGETISAQQEMYNWTKSKAFEVKRKHHLEQKRQARLKILTIERQMLILYIQIKRTLKSIPPLPENCLRFLDQLNNLPITQSMLKKHPEVIKTIKKIRHYVGHFPSCNLTPPMKFLFELQAADIRSKASKIYKKFKSTSN
ncbi:uncharacterized protein [Rhodnius prolixus]|uniref:uncharacterized protein n=1 Tax=Rhodnius prolixus TaxID=13249 RepID=UPI003D18BB1B